MTTELQAPTIVEIRTDPQTINRVRWFFATQCTSDPEMWYESTSDEEVIECALRYVLNERVLCHCSECESTRIAGTDPNHTCDGDIARCYVECAECVCREYGACPRCIEFANENVDVVDVDVDA